MLWKEDQSPRVTRKENLRWHESGRVFSVEGTRTMFQRRLMQFQSWHKALRQQWRWSDQKDDSLLPHPIRRQSRLTVKWATKRKVLTRERSQIVCRHQILKNRSCAFWLHPVCQNYKSERGCIYGDKCHFRHFEAERKPSKKSKKGGAKGSVAILKESLQLGCASQDSYPRKSILRERGNLGSKHTVEFSKSTWHQIKVRERKGPSRRIILKCAPHECSSCEPKFQERSQEETLRQEERARKAAGDLAKIMHKLTNSDKAKFKIPTEAEVKPAPTLSTQWAKKNWAQMNWIHWEGPEPLLWYSLPTVKCTPRRKRKFSFTI